MSDIERRDFLVGATTLAATLAAAESAAGQSMAAEPDYSLQSQVKGLTVPSSLTIIGTGGFGCWPALFLALSGAKEMLLIDPAMIDPLDLARAPFRPSDVGKSKVDALADVIHTFRPNVRITTQRRFALIEDTDIYFGEAIFDGTNERSLGEHLSKEAARRNMRYIQGFYGGLHAAASDGFLSNATFKRGAEVPVWVGGAILAGVLSTYGACTAASNFLFTPDDSKKSREQLDLQLTGLSDMDK
ncbi:ThiF family adenylyltransferase [Rhizobium sp. GCM10022189]|uniref:ThiF family adenylyltransferase n=1 Tax=Rhizobium sp. GCM10022189 TaxID=3252654 RepID=UPI003621C43A